MVFAELHGPKSVKSKISTAICGEREKMSVEIKFLRALE